MAEPAEHKLSRRERQIMDVLYQRQRASAAEIRESLADPPSYSAVRALLRILEEKGHIRHAAKDLRYVYFPTVPAGACGARPSGIWLRPSSMAPLHKPSPRCSIPQRRACPRASWIAFPS